MNNLLRYVLKGRSDKAKEQYERSGYHLFRSAFPQEQVNAIADLTRRLIPSYEGLIRRNSGEPEFNEYYPDTSFIRNPPLNVHLFVPLELAPLSGAVRALITAPALAERLHRLDGAEHYTIHQTILFISTPTTQLHIDSFSLDTAPHGFAHTVWIPLQDMDSTSGVPCVIPWPRGKLLTERDLGLSEDRPANERYDRYQQALAKKLLDNSPEAVMPLMRTGDFAVWSSLTPHFTLPSLPWPKERLALQVLIRPTHCTWGSFFAQPPKWTIDRALKVSEWFSFLFV